MMVAMAAPDTPMFNPKIKMGSRMMFIIAPVAWVIIVRVVFPVEANIFSIIISKNSPKDSVVMMFVYWHPYSMIWVTFVWVEKKNLEVRLPKIAKNRKLRMANRMALVAMIFARSCFCSPNVLDSIELTPTPVPTATAIIRFCRGKARLTAVNAFSLIWATNIESTTLYKACTSIDIIIGMDMVTNSRWMGMVPILFSFIVGILSKL